MKTFEGNMVVDGIKVGIVAARFNEFIVSKGIGQVGLAAEKPVIFGILTTESIEHAVERAGTKAGNKGYDAAVSAIEMVNLMRTIA